jgi:serine/threonine protein kinase
MEAAEKTGRRDALIGATLGNYVVKHWIGAGGMGVVYLAEQPDIGKAVAIKVLKVDVAASADHLKHLVQEARTVNAIRHRGIIDIFGFGTAPDGRQYIVMEYLEGEPLDAHLARNKRLTSLQVLEILDEVLSALGAAHRAGVVHRDLKPGNIFLARQSDGARYIKVLDFGLAKKAERPYGSAEQTHYRPAGTPEYMAPEQARGARVGPRTDLYSVGIVAFELLAGQIPFDAPSLVEILIKHVQSPPPHVRDLEPSVPPELDQLIQDLLSKNPADRPQSAEEVRRRLKPIMAALRDTGSPLAAPEPAPTPIPVDLREMLPLRPNPDTLPSVAPVPLAVEHGGRDAALAGAPASTQKSGPKAALAPVPSNERETPHEVEAISTGETARAEAVNQMPPSPAIGSGAAVAHRAPQTWQDRDTRFGLRLAIGLSAVAALAAIITFVIFKATSPPAADAEPVAPAVPRATTEPTVTPVRIEPAPEAAPVLDEPSEVRTRKELDPAPPKPEAPALRAEPVTRPPPSVRHPPRPPPSADPPRDDTPSEAALKRLAEEERNANPAARCKPVIAAALKQLSEPHPSLSPGDRRQLGSLLSGCR